MNEERRKYPRYQVRGQAIISPAFSPQYTYSVEILNIGGGGVAFETDEDLTVGEEFLLDIPSITLHFYIIWRQYTKYGGMFINPLGNELDLIVSTLLSRENE